jgi:hypothetical protein
LHEAKEALDFSATFRVVGSAKNTLDAQSGTDGVHMLGGVDLALVDVDGQRETVAQDSALETIFHPGQLLIPIELSVRHETRAIVEKGKKKGLTVPVGLFRVREIGTIHGVALPQIAKVKTLEAAIGLGTLLGTQSDGGGTPEGELAAQGAGSDVGFGDRIGVVEFKYLDDGSSRAMRLLALEGTVLYGQYRASARSRVSAEMVRDRFRSERGRGLRPSKPCRR